MSELELFPREPPEDETTREPARPVSASGEEPSRPPLPARMRPAGLEEFEGQRHLLGPGKPLRTMLEGGTLRSMILWGPPGSGKTTLAHLLAERTEAHFVSFSAVTEGVAKVREIIAEAQQRREVSGRSTILFCDEIHRFNKAQQDAFLPHVEAGTVVLIGATTENPSFEVVRPLLSRAPVFVLEPLKVPELVRILDRILEDEARGLGRVDVRVEAGTLELMAAASDGDARRAIGILEAAVQIAGPGGTVDREATQEAVQHRFAVYDKEGEEHFNLISALHKAVRGSDPDAALYWLARMIQGGEDPLYVARRLVRMASEDIGLADPEALSVAMAARDAYHFLGSPEGDLALAEATIYLATAPKSNRAYEAWSRAVQRASETASAPVPLHIRNAPTRLMRELGYGKGYRYDPAETHGVAPQHYLPDELLGERFYEPGPYGFEPRLRERLDWWERKRREAAGDEAAGGGEEGDPPGDAGE